MTRKLLYDQLGTLISVLSVLIAIVLAFLIIYANQFLLKRRKKELGIYMMLGMKKGRIARIFAGETFCIGVIALGIGLILGLFLSPGHCPPPTPKTFTPSRKGSPCSNYQLDKPRIRTQRRSGKTRI